MTVNAFALLVAAVAAALVALFFILRDRRKTRRMLADVNAEIAAEQPRSGRRNDATAAGADAPVYWGGFFDSGGCDSGSSGDCGSDGGGCGCD